MANGEDQMGTIERESVSDGVDPRSTSQSTLVTSLLRTRYKKRVPPPPHTHQ